MRMLRDQRGFTLIEIIMVIVLLGIIAAIAIPQYVDMKAKAQEATANGIVGSIVASAAIGADKAVNQTTATYPTFTELDTTYLKKGATDLYDDGSSNWTAYIGAQTYTFTYSRADGSAGWDTP